MLFGSSHRSDEPHSLSSRQTITDILPGLTVSLALVPEAVAFAFVAGVAPLMGLYAAFIIGLIIEVSMPKALLRHLICGCCG